ncbi:MAG TPA: hypothetical protein VHZ55_03585 [Bryobacteraceae bacterium]|jgi:hypothetical protein|nr:hypothetical protein [Bryobacteraceae bacterium]
MSTATINAPIETVSNTDLVAPTGRTKIGLIWGLSVKRLDDNTCEFTNLVRSSATPEFLEFLHRQGIPFEIFRSGRKPISAAHNRQESPWFAKNIERYVVIRA